MITNETRARLIGWHKYNDSTLWCPIDETELPAFDTDANAVAELRKFVRARGKVEEWCQALFEMTAVDKPKFQALFAMLDATPRQQTAAFDATFKTDLERINDP